MVLVILLILPRLVVMTSTRPYRWGDYVSQPVESNIHERGMPESVQREAEAVRHKLSQTMAQNFGALPTQKHLMTYTASAKQVPPAQDVSSDITDSDSDEYSVPKARRASADSLVTDYYIGQLASGRDISYRRSSDEFENAARALTASRKQM